MELSLFPLLYLSILRNALKTLFGLMPVIGLELACLVQSALALVTLCFDEISQLGLVLISDSSLPVYVQQTK